MQDRLHQLQKQNFLLTCELGNLLLKTKIDGFYFLLNAWFDIAVLHVLGFLVVYLYLHPLHDFFRKYRQSAIYRSNLALQAALALSNRIDEVLADLEAIEPELTALSDKTRENSNG